MSKDLQELFGSLPALINNFMLRTTHSLFRFVLLAATGCWSIATTCAQPAPIRVLPLGDSITYGLRVAGGYRAPLHQLLTNAGYSVDFVGLRNGNGATNLPDSDHEGHPGWRIDQIDSIMLSVFDATVDPNIILVLIGTNDYGQGYDTTNGRDHLHACECAGKYATAILSLNGP